MGLAHLTAYRLIALDKCPGIRPIGIGESFRRIIGKASCTSYGKKHPGCSRIISGQEYGSEAAVHAMYKIFQEEDSEAVLKVDATNAFNCFNRHSTLQNIWVLCPPFATVLINTYREAAELFTDGETIVSQEGTTPLLCECMLGGPSPYQKV